MPKLLRKRRFDAGIIGVAGGTHRTFCGLPEHFVSLKHLAEDGLRSTVLMSTTVTPKPGSQLWGIYYTDREYAREMGDPLRTVVEAPTKLAAEEAAMRLGFGDPWAHPVTSEQAEQAQWLHKLRPKHRQEFAHKPSRGIHI